MTTPIENRAQWAAYSVEKAKAVAAGACRPCSQRIAMAKVKTSSDEPDQAPDLCGRCARLFPSTARAA